VQQPSGSHRTLIAGALEANTFDDSKTPRPLKYLDGATADLVDRVSDLADPCLLLLAGAASGSLFLLVAVWLDTSRSWITAIWMMALFLWPLTFLTIFWFVILPFRWLRIKTRNSLCLLLARRVCPVELEYYQMRNQARLQEDL
jgi:hypothetical protein